MEKTKARTEWKIFIPSAIIILTAALMMILAPVRSKAVIDSVFLFLTHQIGWVFLIVVLALFIISLYIAFSKYGKIKLGGEDDPKQYSDFAWVAMIFSAGMSIAVILLGFMEPINLLSVNLFDSEPLSDKAYEYAHMCAQYFQGPIAWGVYGPASVLVAYMLYVKRGNVLRMSGACAPALKGQTNGFVGTVIDVIVVVGMIGGVSTSLGLGTPAVTNLIEYLTGIPQSTYMTIAVLFIWACIFGTSVFLGLDKGIKRLSNLNLYLLFALMLVVILNMPLRHFVYLETNSIGLMIDHFFELSLGTDIFGDNSFSEKWTVFYWAWWIAFMPMMALFGARVSKGRTIKQLILGELIYGGCGSLLVFGLFGAYSLHLQREGIVDLIAINASQGREQALIAILQTLPFSEIVCWMTLILIFVFLATTIDSTSYTLASVCSVRLTGDEQPARWSRMSWAAILLLFALGLVLIGGLQAIQTASILLAFPLLFVLYFVMRSLNKIFKEHHFK